MKKIIPLIIIFALIFSVTGCDENTKQNQNNSGISISYSKETALAEENIFLKESSDNDSFDGKTVYYSPNGKKYHYSAKCCGKNSTPINIDTAIENGLSPCKKCVKQ